MCFRSLVHPHPWCRSQVDILLLLRVGAPHHTTPHHTTPHHTTPHHTTPHHPFSATGELFTRLRHLGKFDDHTSRLYGAMVASAFTYLHARQIAHRDLKPENLMFTPDGYLKLVDFGFAKALLHTATYCLPTTATCYLLSTGSYCRLLPIAYFACCLLPIAYCLLPTTAYFLLLPTTSYFPLPTPYSLLTAVLLTPHSSLLTPHSSLLTPHCPLLTTATRSR